MSLGLFSNFCFIYKLLGFLGRDSEDIKKQTTAVVLSWSSCTPLRQSVTYGEAKGGRLSCKPFRILLPLPTVLPQRSGQSPENEACGLTNKKLCKSTCKRQRGNGKDEAGKEGTQLPRWKESCCQILPSG